MKSLRARKVTRYVIVFLIIHFLIFLELWCCRLCIPNMLLNEFNISCSLGKYSNNVFYGFLSVKCTTYGILPVRRHEQNEVDDF